MTAADEDARIIAGRYRVLRTLGAGAHGTVDLAEDLLNGGRRVAVKRLEAIVGAGDPEPAAEVLRWLVHPAWAEILDEGRLDEHGRFQVSRYVPGHSLDHVELPRPADEVLRFLEDGARALRALHRRGLIHYDVTPGNWLREDGPEGPRFTLTDGGLASMGPVRGIARGTPAFMAPEILEGAPHDHRADLYSLGLVAWRLLTGTDPHGTGGAGEVLGRRRRVAAPLLRRVRPDAPASLERILAALLERDPERRPADGSALLALLAEAGWARAQDDLLPEEAVAAATGGGLVGRVEPLARFRAACQAMLTDVAPTPADGTPGPRRSPLLDTVLVVSGPSGSGATRLLREMAAVARGDGIATLALSARDGAADRRSVLRRIADGLGALLGEEVSLGGGRDGRDAAEHSAGSEARATERFVDLCERAAARAPVVLLVEDFAELPSAAQEGLRVLSRHLLARVEHPDGRRPPRFLLVVDHGPDDPAGLLIPDAEDPRRPVVALPALTPAEIGVLVADRLPGMELPAPDLEALRVASEGLPRAVTALLAEGLRRGDVRRVGARWIWMVDDLRAYRPSRSVPPAVQRALDAAGREARSALTGLALLDDAAPEAVALELADDATLAELVASGLLARSHVGDDVRYAPISRALRDLLRQQPPAVVAEHRTVLLAAMARRPQLDLVPDEARLLAESGHVRDALARLSVAAPSLLPPARVRAASIAADLCATDATLLADASARLHATNLLVQGPIGNRISDAIVAALPTPRAASDDEVRVRLAEDAFSRSLYARSVELLTPPLLSTDAVLLARRSVALLRSRVALDARSVTRAEVAQIGLDLRSGLNPRSDHRERCLALFSLASARVRFHSEDFHGAACIARRAMRRTRRLGSHGLMAEACNNRAICLQRIGRDADSESALSRSTRIRLAIGDFRGAARTLHNQARLTARRRSFVRAAQLLSQSLALASRYADHEATTQALLTLSSLYDDQGNARLAFSSVVRASALAVRTGQRRLGVEADAYAAGLAVHLGDFDTWRSCARRLFAVRATSAFARAKARVVLSEACIALGRRSCVRRLMADARWTDSLLSSRSTGSHSTAPTQRTRSEPGVAASGEGRSRAASRRALATLLTACRGRVRGATPDDYPLVVSHLLAVESGVPALEHRLVVGATLVAMRRPTADQAHATSAMRAVLRIQKQRQHTLLAARMHAALATSSWRSGDHAASLSEASQALALLHGSGEDTAHHQPINDCVPAEFRDLLAAWTESSSERVRSEPLASFWQRLYATAHRLSLRPVHRSTGDSRVSSALRLIVELAARLKTGAGLEALLDSLNDGARRITSAERACVILLGADGTSEIRVASPATTEGSSDPAPRISQTIIRRVLTTRRPLLVHDIFGDSELMARPSIASLSLRAALCVPLLRGERLYGVMYADSRAGAGSFDQVDLEILSLFAEHASAAIETTRLLADVQRSYAELRSAQDRLVRGERLRVMGELAGGVAHEFNNLLTAILARLQLLALEPLSASLQKEIGMVQRTALDAAEVVRRLQSFSRSQRQADFQRVDLGEVCADVVEFLRPLWSARRMSGRASVLVHLRAARGHIVLGDPTELREVITNLLKNALEALDSGGSIVISVTERGSHVVATVEDDGPGISAELRAKLFTPFFTTKGERGTGLGLCLSQQIVERHGGEISLDSDLGRGTRVNVLLPIASDAPLPNAAARPQSGNAPQRRELSVVVTDDDRNVLDPLCNYLARSNLHVRAALGADETLRCLNESRADVVISDISMPGMNGIELCKVIQQRYPEVRVILMTGRSSTVDVEAATRSGAVAVLPKPFTMRQVTDLLASIAGGGPQA
ncbi:MAG: ATP-binding protein [Planctomycetota bacterium]